MISLPRVKLGLVASNRDCFSDQLAASARRDAIEAMIEAGVDVVAPDESLTKVGCVENLAEAEAAGKLFRDEDVAGIVVLAANFGDERSAAQAVKAAGLNVPVLLVGCQEDEPLTPTTMRRDACCGLLSIGEALRQSGVKYTVAPNPIVRMTDNAFRDDIAYFAGVCRVVKSMHNARYGQIGTRPEAFWTCRTDEKGLQKLGVTTVDTDFSEAISTIADVDDASEAVKAKADELTRYCSICDMPDESLLKIAGLAVFLEDLVRSRRLDGVAVQCWSSMQRHLGICPCAVLAYLTDNGIPAACESDILGTMSMHSAMLASGSVPALADWNNLHHSDPDLINLWHCGVFPASFARGESRMSDHFGMRGVYASIEEEVTPGDITLFRVHRDEDGVWKALVVEGVIEENPSEVRGGYAWCRIEGFTRFYRSVLARHFTHHAAFTHGRVGRVLWEAYGNYLGFSMYTKNQPAPGLWTPEHWES